MRGFFYAIQPRALPWAIIRRPFRPHRVHLNFRNPFLIDYTPFGSYILIERGEVFLNKLVGDAGELFVVTCHVAHLVEPEQVLATGLAKEVGQA